MSPAADAEIAGRLTGRVEPDNGRVAGRVNVPDAENIGRVVGRVVAPDAENVGRVAGRVVPAQGYIEKKEYRRVLQNNEIMGKYEQMRLRVL